MSPSENARDVGVEFRPGGTCPRCQGPGLQLVVAGQVQQQLLCEGCQKRMAPEEDHSRPQLDVGHMLNQCGVNVAGYGHATLDSFDPDPDGAALELCRKWVKDKKNGTPTRSIFLFSERPQEKWTGKHLQHGNGKTHLAVACLRAILEAELIGPGSGKFINVPALFYQIRDTFQAHERSWPLLKKLIDMPLLVLDDLGAEKVTEWTAEALYLILDGRIGRATIITSNYGLKSLKEMDPEKWGRICSRIAGECQLIQLRGPDRRLKR